jgi:F420-non-reducing hydrogenase iron-sulfur subunit
VLQPRRPAAHPVRLQGGCRRRLIGGCHPGDCHYVEGNYKTLRRILLFKPMLETLGVDPRRLRLEWISAAEGKKYAQTMDEFTEQIRALGPLHLNEKALLQEVVKDE